MAHPVRDRLSRFFLRMHPLQYGKGDIILHPEKKSSSIYFIRKGFIRAYTVTEQGEQKLLLIYKRRELFPISWFFNHKNRIEYYEAMGNVVVHRVAKRDFQKFLSSDHSLYHGLLTHIGALFDMYINRIHTLGYTKAYPRLIALLLFFAKRFGKRNHHTVVIAAPLRHYDIASSIAMTRETASREFEKLKEKGLIGYKKHAIIIHSVKKLERELDRSTETII